MPTEDFRRIAAIAMEVVSIVGNVVLTLVCLWATLHLWRMSSDYLSFAGGPPQPSVEYAWAAVNTPGLHLRLWYWFVAWTTAVFAVGAALMSIAGLHWAWRRIRRSLQW